MPLSTSRPPESAHEGSEGERGRRGALEEASAVSTELIVAFVTVLKVKVPLGQINRHGTVEVSLGE